MANIATKKQVKKVDAFNEELKSFGDITGEVFVTLYEDAFTTRRVADFHLYLNGKLKWKEYDEMSRLSIAECYEHTDSDDVDDTISFWRANLRRAKRYWSMNTDTLDKIQNGELEDSEE